MILILEKKEQEEEEEEEGEEVYLINFIVPKKYKSTLYQNGRIEVLLYTVGIGEGGEGGEREGRVQSTTDLRIKHSDS